MSAPNATSTYPISHATATEDEPGTEFIRSVSQGDLPDGPVATWFDIRCQMLSILVSSAVIRAQLVQSLSSRS